MIGARITANESMPPNNTLLKPMNRQTEFFHLTLDGYWVEIKPNSGHRVFEAGKRFLVIDELPDGFLLCWPDGVRPPEGVQGTYVHKMYVQSAR